MVMVMVMELDLIQYKSIVEFSPNMIWRSGTDATCNYFNQTWLKFTGRTLAQELGNGWAEGVHPDDLDSCLRIYSESFAERKPFEMEYRLRRYDGQWRWINDRGVPFFYDNKEFAGYIGSCMDVSEKVEGRLFKRMAQKDGLTGLLNRQYFFQCLEEERVMAQRFQKDLSVIMLDLDLFKRINDQYGHQTGDRVIQMTAQTINQSLRAVDFSGRYGGEEFVIALHDTGLEKAVQVAERLRQRLQDVQLEHDGKYITFTASFGVSSLREGITVEQLIDEADKNMYRAKEAGRNNVQCNPLV